IRASTDGASSFARSWNRLGRVNDQAGVLGEANIGSSRVSATKKDARRRLNDPEPGGRLRGDYWLPLRRPFSSSSCWMVFGDRSASSMLAGDTLASHRAMCTSAAARNAAIFSAGAPTIRMREISLSSACFLVYWRVAASALLSA